MEVALGLAGQCSESARFQSLCSVGKARHRKDAKKVKGHGQDCGSGEGKCQRAKGFPLFAV